MTLPNGASLLANLNILAASAGGNEGAYFFVGETRPERLISNPVCGTIPEHAKACTPSGGQAEVDDNDD